MTAPHHNALHDQLARVRLFLCDVDGVLTDGSVLIGSGMEYKLFHIQDGLGLRLLQRHGVKVGWISNRSSPATLQRAEELKVDFLRQGAGSKVEAAELILNETGLVWGQVCYMGDDVVDLGLLERAGLAVAGPNAIAEVRATAQYVTRQPGGRGAVREVAELILKAQQKWSAVIEDYSAGNP
jgi:3-deoxy-D-manno-octulosonate 8-phosphate phosphatase (KDO 8-P phosphatase)